MEDRIKANTRILIVDDEYEVREILRDTLESGGYRCLEAENAAEALACLKSHSIALVLLDLNLCDMPGVELLSEIKKTGCDVAVIVVSGVCDIDTAIDCVRRGACDYITKPFSTKQILDSAQKAIDQSVLQTSLQDHYIQLEKKVEEQAKELHSTTLGAFAALTFALEAKDPHTAGHSRRVAEMAVCMGKKVGLSEDQLQDLHWGSLLHDIGKIAIDQTIINKPTKLTREEYQHVMTHPMIGASLLAPLVREKGIVEIVENHHAHYRGNGLRQKLWGKNIPVLARIVAIADAYDAMTSDRSYRPALSREEALNEIRIGIGTQFDPQIANVFLKIPCSELTHLKKTVLVVDDDKSVRLLVKSILGNDYFVLEACDGAEAVNLARTQRPDLILMDILMPKMDGLQACCEIRKDVIVNQTKVIMLTALEYNLDRKLSARIGANGYVTKPFNTDDLRDMVSRHLDSKANQFYSKNCADLIK